MENSTFNRIYEQAQHVNIETDEWFNRAGYFWLNCTKLQLEKMKMLLRVQGCKTIERDGEEWFTLENGNIIKANNPA